MVAPRPLTLVPRHPEAEAPSVVPPPPTLAETEAYVGLTGRLPLRRLGYHLHRGLPAYEGHRDELRIRHLSAVN